MGFVLPIWNKIQNLETISGSSPPESLGQFSVVSALIGGSFRPDFEVVVKSMMVVV